jgi:hypothetical protein
MLGLKSANGVSGSVKHAPNFPKAKSKKKKPAPVKAKPKTTAKSKPARRRG